MKYICKNIALALLVCSAAFLPGCTKDELGALEEVTPKVYISQVNGQTINLLPANVIIDKANKVLKVPIGVNRSGNQVREAYAVDITFDNSSLPAGAVPLAADMFSNNKIEVPAGKSSGYVYLTIPKAVLDANAGKKLAIKINIANPSRYELNEQLSAAMVVLEVANFADKSVDVTSQYVKNAGNPFTRSDGGTRFGLLKDWIINPAGKNMENGTKGGFDSYNNGGWMSLERWGTPEIPNGKIYQTVEMPAGKYLFEIVSFDGTPGYTVKDQAYVAVAEGNTLPNAAAIGNSLGNAPFNAPKVNFTLASAKTISFGIVANFIQNEQYFRIKQVKMTQFVNIFD